jgi:site-specific recombinase XerD
MPLELRKFHGNGDCKFRGQEDRRETFKCGCPFYAVGVLNGQRVRQSLRTADTQRAVKLLAKLEGTETGRELATVVQVIDSYLLSIHSLQESTRERRRLYILAPLQEFCDKAKIRFFSEIEPGDLDRYIAGRGIARTTEQHELVVLGHLWAHALERGWVAKNIARLKGKATPKPKPAHVEPFTTSDITRMFTNIAAMRKGRARAYAFLLLLRSTALRIGDAATLEKSRIIGTRIHVRTTKTGQPVFLPVPPALRAALDALPLPHGADVPCRWFFWNGKKDRGTIIRSLQVTMKTVFRGIPDAFPHRFRHTLASELLVRGADEQQVADILGNSAATVRLHYAKWYAGRQAKIDELMLDYIGQKIGQPEKEIVQ